MATKPLPASFAKAGFLPSSSVQPKMRRLMMTISGPANTGKTEFALSAPGPGILLGLDRGVEGMLENPAPPSARNAENFAFHIVPVPRPPQDVDFKVVWDAFYGKFRTAIEIPEARTIVLDGDSDSWELQRMAAFGKLSKVPSINYENVNAARKLMYNRAYDSGKIFIATAKVKKVYETQYNPDGTVKLTGAGNELRTWNGEYERQGFPEQDYLWQLHLLSLYDEDRKQFGVRITGCKLSRDLEGTELWGDDCNFAGLVQTILPDVPLSDWGF
jgi:hypothetical protein